MPQQAAMVDNPRGCRPFGPLTDRHRRHQQRKEGQPMSGDRESVVQRITNGLMPLLDDDNWRRRVEVEKALRAAYNAGLAAVVNTATDNDDDHGTAEHCDNCTGSGCWRVASSLPLTVQVMVRRAEGPAQPTADVLWALQDAVAGIGSFTADTADYEIDHVDYVVDQPAQGTGQGA
jgi:hypothetical protein